jgi:hypothetical protein
VDEIKAKMSEATLVFYLFGAGFLGCLVALMFSLGGTYAPWVGALAGVLGFGIPSWIMLSRRLASRADERDRLDPEPANYGADPEM